MQVAYLTTSKRCTARHREKGSGPFVREKDVLSALLRVCVIEV